MTLAFLRLRLMGLTSESDGKLEKKHPNKFVYIHFYKKSKHLNL